MKVFVLHIFRENIFFFFFLNMYLGCKDAGAELDLLQMDSPQF